MKFRERTDREVDNGEEGSWGQAERKSKKGERGAEVTRAELIRLDAQTECPSAEILSNLHQSPWDTSPGTKSSQTFKWCRKKRGLANWGWENINLENTHAKMVLWDLTKQLQRAISVLKLKYANLIKTNKRAQLTLIEVFSVTSINLWEMLCIRSLSAWCKSLVICTLTVYCQTDGLWNFIQNIL